MIPGKRIRKELIQWKKWVRNLDPSDKRETQQASTHMQKCLIPLLIRSLQIKTRKRCHCIPITKQHFKTLAEMKVAGNFAMGMLRILDKTWVYLVKSSSPVFSDTASPLLATYALERALLTSTKRHEQKCTVVLLIIFPN